jgi:prepilin-type processing-associated H-X9-DG protein
MDFPFPPPRPTVVREWTIIIALLALGFIPIVRMISRRALPANHWDRALGIGGFLLTFVVLLCFPLRWGSVPNPSALPTQVLGAAILALLGTWAFAAQKQTPVKLSHRITEVLVPYGAAGLMFIVMGDGSGPGGHPPEAFYRTQCRNNLKQIGLALHNYYDRDGQFPALVTAGGQPPRSWRVDLLPFLDQAPLRRQYVDTAAWDAEPNAPVTQYARDYLPLFCPSMPNKADAQGRRYAAYFGVRGPDTFFPSGQGLTFAEITDGSSNTIAIVETCGTPIVWTEPRDLDLAIHEIGINGPGDHPGQSRSVLSSYHRHGGNVLFADGSVRFLSEDIDPDVLKALLTASGGDSLGNYQP